MQEKVEQNNCDLCPRESCPFDKIPNPLPDSCIAVKLCKCQIPKVDSVQHHLIGGIGIPRVLPCTSATCKCGGYLPETFKLPKSEIEKSNKFWKNPKNW